MEVHFKKYKGMGLQVVGLTKLSRNKTKEDVLAFLTEANITYPIGQERGDISTAFAVTGIPAAAIIKDGVIIWRGHPGLVSDEKLEGLLN